MNEEDLVNAMDEEIRGVPEIRVPLTVKSPASPTADEVQTHNLTHNPYQSWCPVCVAAQGKEDAHRRDGNNEDAEGALKTIGIDYGFIGDGQEGDNPNQAKLIVAKDFESGALWAHAIEMKGKCDEWVIKQLVSDIESTGRSDIRLKTDGEPAILAVQSEIIARRHLPSRTVPTNPPAYDPQANGAIEKGMQDFFVQLRKMSIALERRVKFEVPSQHPVMDWMIEHAAFIHTRYTVGRDGKTAIERLTGRRYRGRVVEFSSKSGPSWRNPNSVAERRRSWLPSGRLPHG